MINDSAIKPVCLNDANDRDSDANSVGLPRNAKSVASEMVDEFPALPEKFFTFTHERIALLWMKETAQSPVRGRHFLKHRKSS